MAWIYKVGTIQTVTMSESERRNNATEFYNYFIKLNFSLSAICGMLGNIERESWLNPGMKQGTSEKLGWGLIQWTPSTDLTDWCNSKGYNWYDGNAQCELIDSEGQGAQGVSGRWLPTKTYPYSWAQFSQLTDVNEATKAFLYERERSGVSALADRLKYAVKWYEYFSGVIPPTPPTPPIPTTKKRMPIYMMIRRRY